MRNTNRARRPRNTDGGSHWISYSDLMASLLIVFVLAVVVCVYQLSMLQDQVENQRVILVDKEQQLEETKIIILGQTASLEAYRIQLDEKQNELDEMSAQLESKSRNLIITQNALDEKEAEIIILLAQVQSQQSELEKKELQLQKLIGVKPSIIEDLNNALAKANLKATVDENTGDIVLESSVLFDRNAYTIKDDGQELLGRFLPVYLGVLMSDKYADYIGEIIIEGHTDSSGGYMTNMRLSQNRATAVAEYTMNLPYLANDSKRMEKFRDLITVTGRSYSDLVYVNGVEDKEASRRVVFKFRLKDAEMIEEMQRLLSSFGN